MLTREQVEQALPPNLKNAATQQLTDRVNNIVSDPLIAEQIRENFISYTTVLKDGRFKTDDYLSAVTYVSFKLMGLSNQDAYMRTFPNRYQQLLAKGTSSKDIAAYVSAYNKGKLVNLILDQTLVPVWVLNQDVYQKAINVQADLMLNANSEKVRSDAADSLLNHLKRPEVKAVNLNLGVQENSGLTELKDLLTQLAEKQRQAISNGTPTRLIAAQPIIEGEYTAVDSDQTGAR
jgi:hypothetical protein